MNQDKPPPKQRPTSRKTWPGTNAPRVKRRRNLSGTLQIGDPGIDYQTVRQGAPFTPPTVPEKVIVRTQSGLNGYGVLYSGQIIAEGLTLEEALKSVEDAE